MAILSVPNHMVVGARTGFLSAVRENSGLPYNRVAMVVDMQGRTQKLVDIGEAPMPVEDVARSQVQTLIEKSMDLSVKAWETTVAIDGDDVKDDQTGQLLPKVKSAGNRFMRHLNQLVYKTLNGGDGTTYGSCYDSQDFFDSDHSDEGAKYTTSQDNEQTLALTPDNFETVLVAANAFKDDQGESSDYSYNLLTVPSAYKRIAAQICGNPNIYNTGDNETNPWAGDINYQVSNQLDSTAWILTAESEATKPIIVAMLEMPHMMAEWYDPKQPNGGIFYFKFRARYDVFYGDWRLAIQGNT